MEISLIVVAILAVFCQCQGQVIDPASPDAAETGSDVSLTCTCPESDCGELGWHHNGMPLTEGLGVIITDTSGGDEVISMLTLEGVTDESKGKYRCSDPENPFDQAEVTLDVVAGDDDDDDGDDDDDDDEPATTSVDAGDTINLECSAAGVSDIIWFRDDTELKEEDGYIVTTMQDSATGQATSKLTKEDASDEDSGKYTCRDASDSEKVLAEQLVEVSGAGHVRAAMFVTCSAVVVALSAILF